MNYEELSKKMDYWKELIEARKYSKAIDSLIENGKFEAYPVKFMIRDAPDPSEFASEILEAAVIENKPELVKFTLLCNRRKKDINILIELAIALDNLSMVKLLINGADRGELYISELMRYAKAKDKQEIYNYLSKV